jgi:hypothetical protein
MLIWNYPVGLIDWFIPAAVKAMGGGIFATSELGHGSCFTIRVPAWMSAPDESSSDMASQFANALAP